MAELEGFRAQAEVEEQNTQLMIRVLEDFDNGNFDVFGGLLSDDYVCHFPGVQITTQTRSATPDTEHGDETGTGATGREPGGPPQHDRRREGPRDQDHGRVRIAPIRECRGKDCLR
jgi:hypothetical protein